MQTHSLRTNNSLDGCFLGWQVAVRYQKNQLVPNGTDLRLFTTNQKRYKVALSFRVQMGSKHPEHKTLGDSEALAVNPARSASRWWNTCLSQCHSSLSPSPPYRRTKGAARTQEKEKSVPYSPYFAEYLLIRKSSLSHLRRLETLVTYTLYDGTGSRESLLTSRFLNNFEICSEHEINHFRSHEE